MTTKRGMKSDDVVSLRLFRGADLSDVEFSVGALNLLALWLFLSRHADHRAFVVVRGQPHHEREEEGDGG